MPKKSNYLNPISKTDWPLFGIVMILLVGGIVFVLDASIAEAYYQFSDKYHFARNQLNWAILGIVALLISSRVPLEWIRKLSKPFFLLSIFLLFLVIIPGVGVKVHGARRWLELGSFRLQPSELIKLAVILYFPSWLSIKPQFKSFITITSAIILLLMLEPDLGTTIVVTIIAFALYYISGAPIKQILSIISVGLVIGSLLIFSSPYRRERLQTFFNPTQDPLGSSYHIRQVLIGLGSGGVFGTGFGRSRQKFQFLPEATTDSIFAVIAEETGFIGAITLIGLYAAFIIRSFKIINAINETYPKLLAVGALSWISTQALLNLAAMVSLVPLTGITLPFISYGGSSLVAILTGTGVLLNASRYRKISSR